RGAPLRVEGRGARRRGIRRLRPPPDQGARLAVGRATAGRRRPGLVRVPAAHLPPDDVAVRRLRARVRRRRPRPGARHLLAGRTGAADRRRRRAPAGRGDAPPRRALRRLVRRGGRARGRRRPVRRPGRDDGRWRRDPAGAASPRAAGRRAVRTMSLSMGVADELAAIVPGRLRVEEPLAAYTTLRVGGRADFLALAQTTDEVARLVGTAGRLGLPWRIIGRGSN